MKKEIECDKISSIEKIVNSSIHLFAKRWYSSVSIAEICRKAKVSNGLFYHYFSDKENLIKYILDKIVSDIEKMLQKIDGKDLYEKISNLANSMLDYTTKNKELILVFREGQYRYFEYERKLYKIYSDTLKRILNKNIPLSLYVYTFGGLRWICIRKALYDIDISIDDTINIILKGIFNNLDFNLNNILTLPIKFPDISYPVNSKDRLIDAGKSIFGQKEYYEVNIYNITEKANLAVGSFYNYFKSKHLFFEHLVEVSGKQIRHFISENLSFDFNRLETELRGIFLFLNYLKFDKNCYNIVREAEFVSPKKAREYYESFVKGYKKMNYSFIEKNNYPKSKLYLNTVIEFLLGISHYFGIEYIFDNNNIDLFQTLNRLGNLLKKGLEGEDL
ncbi:MAG: TetR/AcrR family transcriptional regulator [Exilispira sp.]